MRCATPLLVAILLLCAASPAQAHRPGEGYIFLSIGEGSLTGRVEMTLRDLSQALDLDDDGDGEISEAELENHSSEVEAYYRDRVAVGDASGDYRLEYVSHVVETHTVGRFARFEFVAPEVTEVPDLLEVEYRGLFDVIPDHRGFLVIESNVKTGVEDNEAISSLLFSPSRPRQTADLTEPPGIEGFMAFVRHGIWHIWIGIDHILFVLSLVMVSVLVRANRSAKDDDPGTPATWEPVAGFVPAFVNLVKIVTLFTVAHSITLTLAALGLVDLSPRLVESVIALSVVLVALNNIKPLLGDWSWAVVFGFGLFHGFGFASVLSHLTQNQSALVPTLLGFNLGVEIGQLAVIALVFPLLFAVRATFAYRRVLLPVGSLVIALIAAKWFFERALDLG